MFLNSGFALGCYCQTVSVSFLPDQKGPYECFG